MAAQAELPSGTVTFLFTDIEGSTKLLHELGERYGEVLAEHRRIVREAFTRHGGVEVDTQGDAFFVAFARATDAVAGAQEAQAELAGGPVRVRMGLHTGEPIRSEEGYVGIAVHHGARIAAAGHGGQVLLSQSTRELLDSALELRDLGEHRLKDLAEPQRLYQLGSEDFPPLKTLYQTNLPVPATPFLGRERELVEVLGLLRSSRLLTLTGPGGSGKTRLAAQAAAEAAEDFPGGLWWVSLAALRDPALVLESIAQVLGAKGELAEHIADKQLLLLLDNLEQLLAAAPELATLLERCPGLRLLVTSREPLRLAAEQEYPVPPFVSAEAVGFFSARARVARPDFQPNPVVVDICRRLDNLPLALELAAARVKLLSPEQILARLEHSLPLLTGGRRDAPERQRTLAATIAWSYELLDEAEQQLFARLSVFAGGCTLEAAEEVCEAELDTLGSLVDKSLLRQSEERFWMLETIREYAGERLEESGKVEELWQRHAEWCLGLASRAQPELRGTGLRTWLDLLEAEHDNVRAAIGWALDRDAALGVRLTTGLTRFFEAHGHVTEARRWLEEAFAREPRLEPLERAPALWSLARFAENQSDYETARAIYTEALDLSRKHGDREGTVRTLTELGPLVLQGGDQELAQALCDESIELARELADAFLLAGSLHNAALVASEIGDLARARELFSESLALRRELQDARAISITLNSLGWIAILEKQFATATSFLAEALALARVLGDVQMTASALQNLGLVALLTGDVGRAEASFGESVELCQNLGERMLAAECLHGLAGVAASRGDPVRCVLLAGAAATLHEAIRIKLSDPESWICERFVEPARAALGAEASQAAWSEGQALNFKQALGRAATEPNVSAA